MGVVTGGTVTGGGALGICIQNLEELIVRPCNLGFHTRVLLLVFGG